jgi:uncharacterized repeat protein (TIGR01451 family)
MFAAGRAGAMTTCGSLVTNVATATMWSGLPDFVPYEVSYNATAAVRIKCPAALRLAKFADLPYANGGDTIVASTGTTVKFTICVINELTFSVWGVTMTDKLPDNVMFVDGDDSWNDALPAGYDNGYGNFYGPGAGTPPGVTQAGGGIRWSNNNTWPGTATFPPNGQTGAMYIRWTFPYVGWTGGAGAMKSACVTFRVKIL